MNPDNKLEKLLNHEKKSFSMLILDNFQGAFGLTVLIYIISFIVLILEIFSKLFLDRI